jgi:hypothetical protein
VVAVDHQRTARTLEHLGTAELGVHVSPVANSSESKRRRAKCRSNLY